MLESLTGELIQALMKGERGFLKKAEVFKKIKNRREDFFEEFRMCHPEMQEFILKKTPELFLPAII